MGITCVCMTMLVEAMVCYIFFFKQKTAYEMRISDWSSDVCSSDLRDRRPDRRGARFHGGVRDRSRHRAAAQGHQLLHQPRGSAAAVRTGADAADRKSVV